MAHWFFRDIFGSLSGQLAVYFFKRNWKQLRDDFNQQMKNVCFFLSRYSCPLFRVIISLRAYGHKWFVVFVLRKFSSSSFLRVWPVTSCRKFCQFKIQNNKIIEWKESKSRPGEIQMILFFHFISFHALSLTLFGQEKKDLPIFWLWIFFPLEQTFLMIWILFPHWPKRTQ